MRESLKVVDSLKSSQVVRISLLISLRLFCDDGDGGGWGMTLEMIWEGILKFA